MENAWIVLFALLGTAVGSFLNVVADRLPAGRSIVGPASSCDACHRRLGAFDLIPVFSYLWLRGRCRYCRSQLPGRILGMELGTGVLFAYLYWQLGPGADLAIAAIYGSFFAAILVIDLEQGLILNKMVFPAMLVALVLSLFFSDPETVPSFASAAGGGGLGLGLFLLIAIVSRGGMGWGDVKLAGLIGLVAGFPLVLVAVMLAVLTGGLAAIAMLALKLRERKQTLPFGVFLALGAVITLMHGASLWDWYLALF
jgi:leader peptidase (prepilin peptidase)/N-methyltransferase